MESKEIKPTRFFIADSSFLKAVHDTCRHTITHSYLTETNVYSYSCTISFDGEGAITSAIDYVTTEGLPQLYVLEGHGEAELSSTFSDPLEKENYKLTTLSLLTVDEIPKETACILIYAPSTDLSEKEVTMLEDYVANGGKLMVKRRPHRKRPLTNLYSLLETYGRHHRRRHRGG